MTTFTEILPIVLSALPLLIMLVASSDGFTGQNTAQAAASKSTAQMIADAKAEKDLLDAETAVINAKKAKIDAQTAISKSDIPAITPSGYTGEAKAENTAGQAEGKLLGAVALNRIADKFAAQLKKDLPSAKIFLLYDGKLPDFQALAVFNARYAALKQKMEKKPEAEHPSKRMMPEVLGTALVAAQNLLSFIKTDYTFTHVDIDLDNAMLLSALACCLRERYAASSALDRRSLKVELPNIYDPASLLPPQEVTAQLRDIIAWEAAESKEAREFLTKLTTPDEKGNIILAEVVRQAALRQKIDAPNTFMVLLQPAKLSGSAYTKKNLWSSLFTNPFHVMGGAVASYSAFDGPTGAVVSSMLLPWHGGYHSVSDVRSVVNNEE